MQASYNFLYNQFLNRFYWYCEILLFFGISGLEAVLWAMWTANLQKIWSECAYLKKSCHYASKL